MFKAKLFSLMGNTAAHSTIRMVLLLSVLLASLLFTGVAGAGPMPGGVGT